MKRCFSTVIISVLLALGVSTIAHAESDGIEIRQAQLMQCDDGYCLSSTLQFELHPSLKEAISLGMPLFFTTEVELTRPRWYWFDERAVSAKQTIRISYNVLTRQYRVSVIGSLLQQSFRTLNKAMKAMRHPLRWEVAEKGQLKAGEKYKVGVRAKLDVSRLPKPFQMHALNSSRWRLSSDWQYFTFTVEK